jgi:hypothetical protein
LQAALRELEPLERQCGMSSAECHRRFVAGEPRSRRHHGMDGSL